MLDVQTGRHFLLHGLIESRLIASSALLFCPFGVW